MKRQGVAFKQQPCTIALFKTFWYQRTPPISNLNAIKISIILNPVSNASINKVTSINSISQSLTHKLNTVKIIILSKLLGDALINRVGHLYSFFQVTLRGCSYERNYTTWAVSRANYFWKTGGRPKLEVPKQGHGKSFRITKQLAKTQYAQSS